ncbi:glutamate receptor ionotropic, kainate 2-like [Diprion similis]|uniref:glutamate receptor ionotropic, kainate 2-like n=1 Tax=Diprion similis TaxID=362088 RepID=UPI001EF8CA18|nr:glutamate receptor ionotropic, kainate 2-like [Diprion similis]
MASPCWLLIFSDKIFLEYYPSVRPGENIFHLTFNTELLVARPPHPVIQEWYWLVDRVKTDDLAFWDLDTGFVLKKNMSLYQRRSNLENSRIAVTVINDPPMITFGNNSIGGLFGGMLMELSKVANFTVEFVEPREMSYGSWNDEEKRWTGMMELLTNGKAGIAAADFTITRPRLESVDFSLPLLSTRNKLYIRKPDGGIQWSAYWQAFAPGIWILIDVLIFVTTILLTLIAAVNRFRSITIDVFTNYLLLVFGIYCQQGLPEFPSDSPSQIAYFSIFLSALVVAAGYSAALISYLTVTSIALPFSTLEGFVKDGTYDLIVFRDGAEYDMFATTTESTMMKMWDRMKYRELLPETLLEGFQQVCDEKVAFYIPAVLAETVSIYLPCKVIGIDTKRSMSLAMALSKGNPYNGLINYHVQRFRDHGILGRLKDLYGRPQNPSTVSPHSEVTVWGVMPVLAVLAGGMMLAILILYLEKICFSYRKRCLKDKEKKNLMNRKDEKITKIRLRHRTDRLPPPPKFYP